MSEEIVVSIGTIKNLVCEIDPELHKNTTEFYSMVIMLSAMFVGADLDNLYEFTGYSRKRNVVKHIFDKAEEIGIFKGGIVCVNWMGDEDWLRLILDSGCLSGEFERQSAPDGDYLYSIKEKKCTVQ